MPDHLWHYTATTGHGHWSPRSEVDDSVLKNVRGGVLMAARESGDGTAEIFSGYSLRLLSEGRDSASFEVVAADGAQLVSCWLQWAGMPEGAPCPLLAVSIAPALALHPDAADWLADAERCIAWALLEERS